jgi:hypothetical protein
MTGAGRFETVRRSWRLSPTAVDWKAQGEYAFSCALVFEVSLPSAQEV